MNIREDDPNKADVASFLREYLDDMNSSRSPESMHVLNVDELCSATVTFWTARGGTNF